MTETPIITYLGQSGFKLEFDDSTFLIDPANEKSGNHDGNLLFCTHSHSDHTGGVSLFLERNPSAIFVCGVQTAEKFAQFEDRIRIVDDGDSLDYRPWKLQFTRLNHGLFKGVHNLGVVISLGDFKFAHSGDAAEYQDFPGQAVNVLAIPIGGGFTSGPGKVYKMVQSLTEPRPVIVPMHWLIRNPQKFCEKLSQMMPDIKCIVPIEGEHLRFNV